MSANETDAQEVFLPIYAEGGIGARLLDAMHRHLGEYEGLGSEPTDFEKALIEDFLNGAFNDEVTLILQEVSRAALAEASNA